MSPPRRRPGDAEALRASLIDHARHLISRDGASALTMRALAAEAGCAVGLPYKVFTDRHELVLAILHAEFERLRDAYDELASRVGGPAVADNLIWFADLLLESPAVGLAHEIFADQDLTKAVTAQVHQSGVGPGEFQFVLVRYLAAEKRAGRVAAEVDEEAFGFVLAGAIHNLIMSGEAWPRPPRPHLARHLTAVAEAIAPRP